MEAPGSVPGVGTEVHDRGYDRDEPVILVDAGEIFSGCRRPLLCFSVRSGGIFYLPCVF